MGSASKRSEAEGGTHESMKGGAKLLRPGEDLRGPGQHATSLRACIWRGRGDVVQLGQGGGGASGEGGKSRGDIEFRSIAAGQRRGGRNSRGGGRHGDNEEASKKEEEREAEERT